MSRSDQSQWRCGVVDVLRIPYIWNQAQYKYSIASRGKTSSTWDEVERRQWERKRRRCDRQDEVKWSAGRGRQRERQTTKEWVAFANAVEQHEGDIGSAQRRRACKRRRVRWAVFANETKVCYRTFKSCIAMLAIERFRCSTSTLGVFAVFQLTKLNLRWRILH